MTPDSNSLPRREFLRHGAFASGALAATALSAPTLTHAAPAASADPDEQFQFAFMGLNGRGLDLLREFVATGQVLVTWLCDVDKRAIEKAGTFVKTKQSRPFKTAADYRRVLEDRRVQGIVMATPDHWHAPGAIAALKAGKHVYVEKPLSHNPREGEMVVDAVRRGKSILQVGLQRRSIPWVIQAVRRVQQEEIGRVRFARAWYVNHRESIGFGQLAPVPEYLDYSLWQGPAPERPFRDNVVHYNWHWFWNWGTGELGNNGVHLLDVARWAMQVDCPVRVTSGGGRYHFEDDQESPDTQSVTYDFGDRMIIWEHRSCQSTPTEGESHGVAFYGTRATLILGAAGYRILDPAGKQLEAVTGDVPVAPHIRNFLECFTNVGRVPAASAEDGHKSTLLCHLGNIAQRTGEVVSLNPKTLQLRDPSKNITRLWAREYRPGWNPAA